MKHESKWRYEIGELMLRFAEIEASIWWCTRLLTIENGNEDQRHQEFTRRCNNAIDAAENSKIKSSTRKAIISGINEAMKLAEMRNLVAHNPISLNIDSLFEDDEPSYEIRSYRNQDKAVELEDLKGTVAEVQRCCFKLHDAASVLGKEILGEDWNA